MMMFWQEIGNYLSTKKGGMPRWLWICIIVVSVLATIIPGILHFVYNMFSEKDEKPTVASPPSGVTHDVSVTWEERQTFWNITGSDASGNILTTRFPTLIVKKGDSIHFTPTTTQQFCILNSRECWKVEGVTQPVTADNCDPTGVDYVVESADGEKNCVNKGEEGSSLTLKFEEARNYFYSDDSGVNRGIIVVLENYITAKKDLSEYDIFNRNMKNLGRDKATQDLLRRRGLKAS